MSNKELIIAERSRDIGDFLVGRLLPFREKRMVGPFIFIDHMGPSEIGPGHYMDVGQHPHIGLSTLTYLFEGEIEHRDTTGAIQLITPGSVNWMTAGRWVVHTERTPQSFRESGKNGIAHGFQIWVALPKEEEDREPSFHHFDANDLPKWNQGNIAFTLVAGEAFGHKAPVPVFSPLFMVEIQSEETQEISLKDQFKGEIGLCVVKGAIQACEHRIEAGNLLVSKENDACSFTVEKGTHLLLFGGEPFAEERHIFWNFVSHDKAKIEEAAYWWKEKEFEPLQGDDSYVPLPNS